MWMQIKPPPTSNISADLIAGRAKTPSKVDRHPGFSRALVTLAGQARSDLGILSNTVASTITYASMQER